MLEHHNSSNNIVEDISFDFFFIDLGKDAICAYQRGKGEAKIDELYEMLDRTRCFYSERINNLDMMKTKVEECYQNFKLDELLALREFVYYEISKNGEIYRLQQEIKFLENAIYCSHVFTSENYMSKIRYYLCNEYDVGVKSPNFCF